MLRSLRTFKAAAHPALALVVLTPAGTIPKALVSSSWLDWLTGDKRAGRTWKSDELELLLSNPTLGFGSHHTSLCPFPVPVGLCALPPSPGCLRLLSLVLAPSAPTCSCSSEHLVSQLNPDGYENVTEKTWARPRGWQGKCFAFLVAIEVLRCR